MEERIATIPNFITLCRFLLIPFFVMAMIYNETDIAVLLFGSIALGDALDGLSARILKQKTRIGYFIDGLTDWLAIASMLIVAIFVKKYVPLAMIIILFIPAIMILMAKAVYMKKSRKKAHSLMIGKITGAFAYITIISFLTDFRYKNTFLIIITLLAYITAISYFVKDVKLFIK